MSVVQRIKRLEEETNPPPAFEVVGVGMFDWTESDLDRAEAEARERLGPDAYILRVRYTNHWREEHD